MINKIITWFVVTFLTDKFTLFVGEECNYRKGDVLIDETGNQLVVYSVRKKGTELRVYNKLKRKYNGKNNRKAV